ncbi:MAG: hypothetical protein GY719_01745 [bacterium]|nr:hypothetical protein [bacterium]
MFFRQIKDNSLAQYAYLIGCQKTRAMPISTVGYEKRHNAVLREVELGEEGFVGSILEGQPEPPLYFARMKRLNKEGPPVLGELPRLRRLAGRLDLVVGWAPPQTLGHRILYVDDDIEKRDPASI